MKMKHNKRHNPGFIFEVLLTELTKSMVVGDEERQDMVVAIIREFFGGGSELAHEFALYNELHETRGLSSIDAEKLLHEVKSVYASLQREVLQQEKIRLVHTINKLLTPQVYTNFVPNYKSLATISQILSQKTSPAAKVMLERQMVDQLSQPAAKIVESLKPLKPIDNLEMRLFTEKFNKAYKHLLTEQIQLLQHYITSLDQAGALELQLFLHEEIGRLKTKTADALKCKQVADDKHMTQKTQEVVEFLDKCSKQPIDRQTLENILKIQLFVHEVQQPDDSGTKT